MTAAVAVFNGVYADAYVALEQGFFNDELLDVELTTCGAANCAQQLQSNAFDVVVHDASQAILATETGGDPLIVAATIDRLPYFVAVDADTISSWEDMPGQAIGVGSLQGTEAFMVRRMVEAAGYTPGEDIDLLAVGGSVEKISSLEAGAVAGATVFPPQIYQLEAQGFGILDDTTDLEESISNPWVVRRSWAEDPENDETLMRFLRGIHRAHLWLLDPANREEAESIVGEWTDVEPQYVSQLYDIFWTEGGLYSPDGTFDVNVMSTMQDMLEEDGLLSERSPDDTWVDLSYMEDAIASASDMYGP